jgi:hypothetical protein
LGGPKGSIKYTIPWPYWSTLSPEKYFPCKVTKACVTEEVEEEEEILSQNLTIEQA